MVATAWASLVALGEEGFCVHVRSIMEASRRIAKGIEQIKGLVLLGTPQAMVICFTSFLFNIYSLGDAMNKKGWHLNSLQNPPCIHICVTPHTVKVVDKFLTDLKEVTASIEWDDTKPTGNAAIYGMAASLPSGPVNELLRLYHDVLLTA
jgi:sphinganine-1-phosphate aldolase